MAAPHRDYSRVAISPSGDPTVVSKLRIPTTPAATVRRDRLFDLLSSGTERSLTLVTAMAGTGKTALAASWSHEVRRTRHVAWLTLEESDNRPGTFWFYVCEALRSAGVDLPGVPTVDDAEEVEPSFWVRLVSDLANCPEPVVLILDEFDAITDRRVADALVYTIRRAGPMLRIVLISRIDAFMPVSTYRLRDELTEIRAADLAFTAAEAGELLRLNGVELPYGAVSSLASRVNGWAAGLRLAAWALDRVEDRVGFVDHLATRDDTLPDYLLSEVLAEQPADMRDFLLRTSILERVWPDLANVLTGRSDGWRTLSRLERDFAFVQAVQPSREWFRYGRLFADILRLQLRVEQPDVLPELHRRAARWLADAGELEDAVKHAAEVDWRFAASLLVDHRAVGSLITSPATNGLARCVATMPADVTGADSAVVLAARALSSGDRDAAIVRLATLSGPNGGDEPRAALRLATALVTMELARVGGDVDAGCAAATAARAALSELDVPPTADAASRMAVLALHGEILLWAGRHDEAEGVLREGLALGACDGAERAQLDVFGLLAILEAIRGRLRAASALVSTAGELSAVTVRAGSRHPARAVVASAIVFFERGDLTSARRELRRIRAQGHPDSPLVAMLAVDLRARLVNGRPEREGALRALQVSRAEAVRRMGGRPLPEWLDLRMTVTESAILAQCDERKIAIAALEALAPGRPDNVAIRDVALARVWVAAGEPDTAAQLCEPIVAAGTTAPASVLTDAWLVKARVAAQSGRTAQAGAALRRALRLARRENRRQPFVVDAAWIPELTRLSPLVAAEAVWLGEPWLPGMPGPSRGPGHSHGSDPRPAKMEDLSARELEVLIRLAQMMSTQDIAEHLYVSPNTVKTHLKNIYRKLGVSRRNEAVRRARELKLL